jgi:hypothetical protein
MKKNLLFILMGILITGASIAQGPCTPFTFSFTTTEASCPNNNDGTADVMVSGGSGPYIYWWSSEATVQSTSMVDSLLPGAYSVIVSDMLGCIDTGFVTVTSMPAEMPAICMVTANGNSTYNIVYWDKTLYTTVDSFIVYREVMPGAYSRIAAVSNDSLSEYIDTSRSVGPANGDPNLASYRYKIQILDTCGNYGPMSLYHNTIYITNEGAGEFAWSMPYTIEGMANPVTNYILLCDTANVDVWGPVSTVSGTDTTAVDPGFATHGSIANWRVKTGWPITCTPTRATVNTSRSNIKQASMSVGISTEMLSASVAVYPNPASDQVSVSISPDIKSATIRIINVLGQQVMSDVVNSGVTKQIDVSNYAKGLYTIVIENKETRTYKKLLVK